MQIINKISDYFIKQKALLANLKRSRLLYFELDRMSKFYKLYYVYLDQVSYKLSHDN